MKRNFEKWFSNFKEELSSYAYYTNFEKAFKNIDTIKVELNILNSLIGSKEIENDFRKLMKDYPQILKCIPILLAVRKYEIYILDVEKEYNYDFKAMHYDIEKYIEFMHKTGIFNLISNRIINNLIDYVLGVEVGLDSNSRKNRGGALMEDLVEGYLLKCNLSKNKDYFKELKLSEIENKWGLSLKNLSNQGKSEKKFDFVVYRKNTVYAIETNFYVSQGSKLNETARSYKNIAISSKNSKGFQFIWVTDGKGWKASKKNLEEAFDVLDDLYCIFDLENGVFENLFQ